ncbi:hypothetical protein MRO89_04950 [Dickeya dianthicola]|uniref:hypothetical protein n=1 Tax=Dickeya dianthicola TaxID=204039 RepID=UPI001F622301|nr:hypothetical protein [Dickeya dianthicola]MCI4185316.1 hypothetical protein [Dickeya dianthicola]
MNKKSGFGVLILHGFSLFSLTTASAGKSVIPPRSVFVTAGFARHKRHAKQPAGLKANCRAFSKNGDGQHKAIMVNHPVV